MPKTAGNSFDVSFQYAQMEKLEKSGSTLVGQNEALEEATRRRRDELAKTIQQLEKLAQKRLQLDAQMEQKRGSLHALLQEEEEDVEDKNSAISYRRCERRIDKQILRPLDRDLERIRQIIDASGVREVMEKVDESLS